MSLNEAVLSEFTMEELKYTWVISNWLSLKHNENQISKENYSISTIQPIITKWKIGLTPDPSNNGKIIFTWTLLELEKCMRRLQASIKFSVVDHGFKRKIYTSKESKIVNMDEVNLITKGSGIPTTEDWRPGQFLDSYGRLHISVKLTLMLPSPATKKNLAEAALRMESIAIFRRNQLALLNDSTTSDVKIVANDGGEIMAHKLILQAQCPVFASMFRSEFAESTDGIIRIEDLCGKVVNILLHFFYTGELQASWCDSDVIVEFTYAAGKYQLTSVLSMLDNILGDHDNDEHSQNNVLLLSIVNKLSLKNAEKRLLDRIKKTVTKCVTAVGFCIMFGLKVQDDGLKQEEIGKICEVWEETLEKSDNVEPGNAGYRDVFLLNLAANKRLKNLESAILKRIINTIQRFETAEELFGMFHNVYIE